MRDRMAGRFVKRRPRVDLRLVDSGLCMPVPDGIVLVGKETVVEFVTASVAGLSFRIGLAPGGAKGEERREQKERMQFQAHGMLTIAVAASDRCPQGQRCSDFVLLTEEGETRSGSTKKKAYLLIGWIISFIAVGWTLLIFDWFSPIRHTGRGNLLQCRTCRSLLEKNCVLLVRRAENEKVREEEAWRQSCTRRRVEQRTPVVFMDLSSGTHFENSNMAFDVHPAPVCPLFLDVSHAVSTTHRRNASRISPTTCAVHADRNGALNPSRRSMPAARRPRSLSAATSAFPSRRRR